MVSNERQARFSLNYDPNIKKTVISYSSSRCSQLILMF